MGAITVTYPSAPEKAAQYDSAGVVSNSETNAIVLQPLSADAAELAQPGGNTQGTLYIDFTKGSLTKVQIRLYGSYKTNPGAATAADWFQETVETDTAGVATLDLFVIELTATARIAYHFPIGAYSALKWTVQSVGTTTSSAIKLDCCLRTN